MCGACYNDTCKGDPCLLVLQRNMLEGVRERAVRREPTHGGQEHSVDSPRPWHEGPRGLLGGGGRFGYPLLWDRIHGNLFQGGFSHYYGWYPEHETEDEARKDPDRSELPHEFTHVVSLFPWGRYLLGPGTDRYEFKFYDSNDQPLDEVLGIARLVNDLVLSGPTLVHCQMGLNRSGLIVGTALVLQGMSPDEAVDLQRDRRDPYVLCNPMFEYFVRRLPKS